MSNSTGEMREKPIRAGVFNTVDRAETAVRGLLAAGFSKEEITVVCSNEAVERHFRAFDHQDPAGEHTPEAAVAGGTIGALLGGASVVALGAATGGAGLLLAGGVAAWAGAVVGGLAGAMMTRGVEKELADYYDQAVQQGKILVAAEAHDPGDMPKLGRASRILADAGAEPIVLSEG